MKKWSKKFKGNALKQGIMHIIYRQRPLCERTGWQRRHPAGQHPGKKLF